MRTAALCWLLLASWSCPWTILRLAFVPGSLTYLHACLSQNSAPSGVSSYGSLSGSASPCSARQEAPGWAPWLPSSQLSQPQPEPAFTREKVAVPNARQSLLPSPTTVAVSRNVLSTDCLKAVQPGPFPPHFQLPFSRGGLPRSSVSYQPVPVGPRPPTHSRTASGFLPAPKWSHQQTLQCSPMEARPA